MPTRPTREDGSEADHLELLADGRTVPLGFARSGSSIYLVARERSSRWPVTVLREGRARLRSAGAWLEGATHLVTEPAARERALEMFRAKYGEDGFRRWYDHPARVLEVELGQPAVPSAPGTPGYYRWLAAEFDNVADDYDRHIFGNRINRLLRERSLAELRRAFADAPFLLEIGCGSGTETLPLLEEGHEVLCIDISQRMLDTVRAKARADGLTERLRTRRLRAGELAQVERELGAASLDGAYSTYGALNCEVSIDRMPAELHRLLRPGRRFVTAVYNRWCLVEMLGYSLTGRPSRAFGRVRRPVPVGASRFCVDVFAFSVPEVRRTFARWFSVERLGAVPFVLPPSDLAGYAERFARRFETLAAWDRALAARWPWRYLGDHFLLTFVRRDAPDGTGRSS